MGYYGRFIDKFAVKSSPLRELLKKDCAFVWEERHEKAFNELKEALVTPVLIYPDLNRKFILTTDASHQGSVYFIPEG